MTQVALARSVGISQARQSDIERGDGAGLPLETWFAEAAALEIRLTFGLARDHSEDVADAGHLSIQELALRLGRSVDARAFELPLRPTDTSLVADVGLRDDRRRALMINECWNRFGAIGPAVRNTQRKLELLRESAVVVGGADGPYQAAACWIVRDTKRNRELLARYPEVFAAAFPASSSAWVRALTQPDAPIPEALGLVWCDLNAGRIFAWRQATGP